MRRCYDAVMRTTLDIDDTVLAAARSLARAEKISVGAAVSRLAQRGLRAPGGSEAATDVSYSPFPVLIGAPEHPVGPDLVAEYRDDD